jgi:putative FmdB family regulatory protein
MPIYEYECLACGKIFETVQKISEEPLTECRYCGGRVNRLISNCSFQLKGTGWYVTDYKSSSSSPGNGSRQSESKEEKSESKVEAKTEEKKETKSDTAPTQTAAGTA